MNAPLLLAIDVGNSRTKFALFQRDRRKASTPLPRPFETGAVARDDPIPWNDVFRWIERAGHDTVHGVVAGSHPGGVGQVLATWPTDWPQPRVLDSPAELPIPAAVDAPEKVGIDRLLNSVAANRLRPADRAATIVDCGTATTVDVVSAEGVFLGGAILPGFEMAASSLNRYTASLPLIPIEELAAESHEPLGTNTRSALRSGLFWGQLGAIRELIGQLHRFIESEADPIILLTGGGAALLEPHLEDVEVHPHLALQGLAMVAALEDR